MRAVKPGTLLQALRQNKLQPYARIIQGLARSSPENHTDLHRCKGGPYGDHPVQKPQRA
jgi:hypothetical protein